LLSNQEASFIKPYGIVEEFLAEYKQVERKLLVPSG
jgi:hypothetical protein